MTFLEGGAEIDLVRSYLEDVCGVRRHASCRCWKQWAAMEDYEPIDG